MTKFSRRATRSHINPVGPGYKTMISRDGGRTWKPGGYLWQSFSDDQGKTWTEPERTPMWGFPGHVLVLPDGRILCTYGYRRPPMGIRASVSHDNGRTWAVESEYVLRDDGKHRGADIGYPTSTVRSDGSIFTIYYINLEDNITHIAGTIWSLE